MIIFNCYGGKHEEKDHIVCYTTTARSIIDKDVMCSGVVGLFGEPFDIETSAEFTSAVLTFKVDKSMLGDTEFDNLMFLW